LGVRGIIPEDNFSANPEALLGGLKAKVEVIASDREGFAVES
jgi:hypothetical protein